MSKSKFYPLMLTCMYFCSIFMKISDGVFTLFENQENLSFLKIGLMLHSMC